LAQGDESERRDPTLGDLPAERQLSHADAELLISKAWDGEITATEAELLSLHLQHCPQCAMTAEEMSRVLARLDYCLKRGQEDQASP
jgi:anti-sigma factor RsiW